MANNVPPAGTANNADGSDKRGTDPPRLEQPTPTTPLTKVAPVDGDRAARESVSPAALSASADLPLHLIVVAHDLAEIFAWVKAVTNAWNPADPLDISALVPMLLGKVGVDPGLWTEINWSGVMAIDAEIPLGGYNVRAHGSVATRSASKVIEAFPEGPLRRRLGDDTWELVGERLRVIARELPTALEFAHEIRDFEKISVLLGRARGGHGVQLVADQISTESLNIRRISAAFDVGIGRDLQLSLTAEGPFAALGADTLGPARTASTVLEKRILGAPVLVLALSLGSPKTLHMIIDRQVPLDRIPAPFSILASDAVSGAHALLDQLEDDVVIAVYLSDRGKATLLLAANVGDDAAALAALRQIDVALFKAVEHYGKLAGWDESAFKVTYKGGGANSKHVKGDLLSIAIHKSIGSDTSNLAFALNHKSELELFSAVDRGVAVIAIGGGVREIVDRRPRRTLSSDSGLNLARAAAGGCQICLSVDPIAVLRLMLGLRRADMNEPAQLKAENDLSAKLAKIGRLGDVAFGAQFTAERATVAIVLPKGLLIPDSSTMMKLRPLVDRIRALLFT
jgi:hypothetical protein